jgi:hypothetical protein
MWEHGSNGMERVGMVKIRAVQYSINSSLVGTRALLVASYLDSGAVNSDTFTLQ